MNTAPPGGASGSRPQFEVQERLLAASTHHELDPVRVGLRLRHLREALDLTPAEISDQLGLERTYWSRWEGGKRPFTTTVAALLAERFGVSLDYIFLGKRSHLPLGLAMKIRDAELRAERG